MEREASVSPPGTDRSPRHRSRTVEVGCRVVLSGLISREDLNGRLGLVTDFSIERQRFVVCVDGEPRADVLPEKVCVKRENLELWIDIDDDSGGDPSAATPSALAGPHLLEDITPSDYAARPRGGPRARAGFDAPVPRLRGAQGEGCVHPQPVAQG